MNPVIDKHHISSEQTIANIEGQAVFNEMFKNYNTVYTVTEIGKKEDDWYKQCSMVIKKLMKEDDIIPAGSDEERLNLLDDLLVEHIVDMLIMNDKIHLLNYIYSIDNSDTFKFDVNNQLNTRMKRLFDKSKEYMMSKLLVSKGITGILMFNGVSRVTNRNFFVLNENKWIPASPEDINDLKSAIGPQYQIKNPNNYIGFIGFENKNNYMVYKVKDMDNPRSSGFRCDQSGKDKIMDILNDIESDVKYSKGDTKESKFELCVRQEFVLRSFDKIKLNKKRWFVDTETAIINEFEKKEKK
jgi:hypothetical protein